MADNRLPVLILQHQTPERPAYLVTWLDQHHISYQNRCAAHGPFPASMEPYSALAVMGGGMSANDDLVSNRQAEILILQAMRWNRPVIGHCLGGQLMTRALGGTVAVSPQPEIGWHSIRYTDRPEVREWFGDSPAPTVIQWHYDTFSVPTGAVHLAASQTCPAQAWSIGSNLAMQFHIEMDQDKLREWAADEDPLWKSARDSWPTVQDSRGLLDGIERHLAQHQIMADHIYRRWLSTTEWHQNC